MSQTDSDAQQDQDFDPTPDNPGLPRLVRVYLRQVVMRMAVSEDKTPRGGRRAPVAVAQPARVRVATGR